MNEIELLADYRDGKPVYEAIPARALGDGTFEILSSPGFAPGFARGDIVRKNPQERLGYTVEKRGGNVCVQAFFRAYSQEEYIKIARIVESNRGVIEGGKDGRSGNLLIFAFHVSAGFSKIENTMEEITKLFLLDKWIYGNVYDTKDGKTPLNWWKELNADTPRIS